MIIERVGCLWKEVNGKEIFIYNENENEKEKYFCNENGEVFTEWKRINEDLIELVG